MRSFVTSVVWFNGIVGTLALVGLILTPSQDESAIYGIFLSLVMIGFTAWGIGLLAAKRRDE